MSNTHSNYEHIPFSKECSMLNKIATYTPVNFTASMSDLGFIARILELNLFEEHQSKFTTFSKLTGYAAPHANLTLEELSLLIIKANTLLDKTQNSITENEQEIASIDNTIKNGRGSSHNEIGNASQNIAMAKNLLIRKNSLENKRDDLKKQKEHIDFIISQLSPFIKNALYREVALEGDYQRILNIKPLEITQYEYTHRSPISGIKSVNTVLNEFDDLLSSINDIIKRLTPESTSRIKPKVSLLNQARLIARRFYLSPNGENVRQYMTIDEYQQLATQNESFIKVRNSLMNRDLHL